MASSRFDCREKLLEEAQEPLLDPALASGDDWQAHLRAPRLPHGFTRIAIWLFLSAALFFTLSGAGISYIVSSKRPIELASPPPGFNTTVGALYHGKPVWPGAPGDTDERLAICVAARDIDIDEWLLHHYYHLGVRRFYIMDDRSSEHPYYLQPHFPIPKDVITNVYYSQDHRRELMQYFLYDECIRIAAGRHRWMAFIDTDEFFEMTASPGQNLASFMDENFSEFPGLGVNWIAHSSDNHLSRQPDLRHHYFTCVGNLNLDGSPQGMNRHVKSIMRTDLYMGPLSPHSFRTKDMVIVVDELGLPLPGVNGPWRDPPTQTRIALHHYVLKSREEYDLKMSMGNALDDPRPSVFWDWIEKQSPLEPCRGGFRQYWP